MRIKSAIWVKGYVRRCAVAGVAAVVVRHGDDDAGAVFIRINRLDGTSLLFGPAPAGLDDASAGRQWVAVTPTGGNSDAAIDAYLAREAEFDSDLWIVESEDRAGRHFLEDWLVADERASGRA